jgi:muramoyltetrapeptide carboxypeptidase LdcA involved in peptidoglycan recycling
VVAGCRFGHISNPLALPLGLPALLDTQTRCITLLASITTE